MRRSAQVWPPVPHHLPPGPQDGAAGLADQDVLASWKGGVLDQMHPDILLGRQFGPPARHRPADYDAPLVGANLGAFLDPPSMRMSPSALTEKPHSTAPSM